MLTCGTHGDQPETYVCKHIAESLREGKPRGFFWSCEDDEYEAICSACNELSPEEFQKQAENLIQSLCFGCFRDAADLNGIDII